MLNKRLLVYLFSGFFCIAGVNHFIHPNFYLPLIPDYFGYPEFINIASGVLEIVLAIGLLFTNTQKTAAYLIIALLIAFIPSHIYFIQIGSCIPEGLCVPAWIAWLRLIVIHPLLIWWAWYVKD